VNRCTLMLGVVMGLGACGQTVAPPPPGSRNYYVDGAAGNDAAAGDSAHPFKTIQHAANLVNPGDVVVVRNGLYTGSGSILDIERGGTTGNYVVFRAAVQWGAVLDGGQTSHSQPNGAENGVYLGASFVRVEGFEIRNVWHDGISPSSSASDFQIVGNHIHDIGRYCETSGIGLSGMTFVNDNVVVEQNLSTTLAATASARTAVTRVTITGRTTTTASTCRAARTRSSVTTSSIISRGGGRFSASPVLSRKPTSPTTRSRSRTPTGTDRSSWPPRSPPGRS